MHSLSSYWFWFIVLAIRRTAFFCSGDNPTHWFNNSFTSGVNNTISPSAKNWDSVMPKPAQIASSVGIDGVVFLLKKFANVDSDNPHILDSRYSVHPRSSISFRSFPWMSTILSPFATYFTVQPDSFIPNTCNVFAVLLNCIVQLN